MLRSTAPAIPLIFLALTACSGSGSAEESPQEADESQQAAEKTEAARTTTENYIDAVRTADGDAGCVLLTDYGRERLDMLASFEGDEAGCAPTFTDYAEDVGSGREDELTEISIDRVELGDQAESATIHLDYPEGADAGPSPSMNLKWIDGRWLLDGIYEL